MVQQSSQEIAPDIAPVQSEPESNTTILPTPKKHRNWADDSEDEDDDLGIEEYDLIPSATLRC